MSHLFGGSDPTLLFSFVAGLVSFLSPCVLPVIPAFLAHLAGTTLDAEEVDRYSMFFSAFLFVLGFSLVFAILGVLINSVLEQVANQVLVWLSRVAGVIIILFGLHLAGLINISFLEREHTFDVPGNVKSKHITSFLFGAAFAVGWTPCVGPILGSIFTLAAVQPGSAFVYLLTYSLGLGIPFLLVGLFPTQSTGFIKKYRGPVRYVTIMFGYILIIIGILVFTMHVSALANVEILNEVLL